MASSLSKFDPQAKLIGDTLVVTGDGSGPPIDQEVLVVLVSQGGEVAAGVIGGTTISGRWSVSVTFGGFSPGPAIATGLIVTPMTNVPPDDTPAPGGLRTFTWADRIEIVQG